MNVLEQYDFVERKKLCSICFTKSLFISLTFQNIAVTDLDCDIARCSIKKGKIDQICPDVIYHSLPPAFHAEVKEKSKSVNNNSLKILNNLSNENKSVLLNEY